MSHLQCNAHRHPRRNGTTGTPLVAIWAKRTTTYRALLCLLIVVVVTHFTVGHSVDFRRLLHLDSPSSASAMDLKGALPHTFTADSVPSDTDGLFDTSGDEPHTALTPKVTGLAGFALALMVGWLLHFAMLTVSLHRPIHPRRPLHSGWWLIRRCTVLLI